MSDDGRRNLPVPDMLHEVREKIRELQTEEAELRQAIFADPTARTGVNWVAEIKTTSQQRTDLKELRAQHPLLIEEFTYPVEIVRIELLQLTEDGEITRPERRTKQQKVA